MDKPEALRLADELDDTHTTHVARIAAAELRRLHAENALLGNAADKLRMAWRDEVHCLMQDKRQLIAQRKALLEALKPMIDLAEFWINHRQERYMSEQEYRVWIALGHESNAMIKARAAIKAVEEGK